MKKFGASLPRYHGWLDTIGFEEQFVAVRDFVNNQLTTSSSVMRSTLHYIYQNARKRLRLLFYLQVLYM
jgi:hypothetical protein